MKSHHALHCEEFQRNSADCIFTPLITSTKKIEGYDDTVGRVGAPRSEKVRTNLFNIEPLKLSESQPRV